MKIPRYYKKISEKLYAIKTNTFISIIELTNEYMSIIESDVDIIDEIVDSISLNKGLTDFETDKTKNNFEYAYRLYADGPDFERFRLEFTINKDYVIEHLSAQVMPIDNINPSDIEHIEFIDDALLKETYNSEYKTPQGKEIERLIFFLIRNN